ncbi:MAG: hypothetical protein RJA63_2771, partial [Pseudomonadota bacterium]
MQPEDGHSTLCRLTNRPRAVFLNLLRLGRLLSQR